MKKTTLFIATTLALVSFGIKNANSLKYDQFVMKGCKVSSNGDGVVQTCNNEEIGDMRFNRKKIGSLASTFGQRGRITGTKYADDFEGTFWVQDPRFHEGKMHVTVCNSSSQIAWIEDNSLQ